MNSKVEFDDEQVDVVLARRDWKDLMEMLHKYQHEKRMAQIQEVVDKEYTREDRTRP